MSYINITNQLQRMERERIRMKHQLSMFNKAYYGHFNDIELEILATLTSAKIVHEYVQICMSLYCDKNLVEYLEFIKDHGIYSTDPQYGQVKYGVDTADNQPNNPINCAKCVYNSHNIVVRKCKYHRDLEQKEM